MRAEISSSNILSFSIRIAGLHGVEAPGQAKTNVVVFFRALSVHADAPQRLRSFASSGENRAAIAEAAERLGGKEAGRGRVAEGAELAALVARAKGLRGIIEHEQALVLRDRGNRIMVGALAKQVDRDDRARLQAKPARGRDAAPEGLPRPC